MGAPEIWKSTEPLLRWNGWTSWTIGHSFEHAFALGRTGSAKSSTLIHFASKAVLRAGYGCLFQTTKKSDTATYLKWINEAGRSDSLVMIDTLRGLGSNLIKQELDYGADHSGKIEEEATENVVRLFQFITSLTGGTNNRRGETDIWDDAAKVLLRNALTLVYIATGTVSIDDLNEVVASSAESVIEAESPAWRRDKLCGQFLDKAEKSHPDLNSVKLAGQYFTKTFPRLAKETRTSVLFNYSSMWGDTLARDPLRSLFFGKTDYTMDILLQGAVVLVNLPVDEKMEIGRVANGLARWAAQQAIQRRNDLTGNREAARPVAIIWDECQKTLCETDVSFQATARDRRCMVLGGTQTIGFMRAPVGKDLGEGFASNCNTKVFYQNQDPDTNRFMSEVIGKITRFKTKSKTTDSKGHTTKTKEEEEEDAVPARMAQDLKTGGEEHDLKVTAILTRGGQNFLPIYGFGRRAMKLNYHQEAWGWNWFNFFTRNTAVCARPRPAPDFRHLR